jgi:hypothetical protein
LYQARATKDLDFLGRLDNTLENLERVVRDVCTAEVEPDGMMFDPATVKTSRIREDADYQGVRVRFVGLLGKARVAMQLDVGFGDVVTPGAENITYPALLDFPAPELAGYPGETVVAEKFQAMVYLRTLKCRMKDFYDLWLPRITSPSTARCSRAPSPPRSPIVRQASTSLRSRSRRTSLNRHRRWCSGTAFRKRLTYIERCPAKLAEVVACLSEFLLPIAQALNSGKNFNQRWSPGGPWT